MTALLVDDRSLLDLAPTPQRVQVVADEDRARDLEVVAAHRAADLALADKLFAELVDQPDIAPPAVTVGPTERWRQELERRSGADGARRRAAVRKRISDAARRREARKRAKVRARSRHQAWQHARISIDDVDPVAVERLAGGLMPAHRATYPERVLAVDACRTVGLSARETAIRMRLRTRAVERMRRHARILRDGVGQ